MQGFKRKSIDGLLVSWGLWVRQGRTWQNRLGYPQASIGFGQAEPATVSHRTPQRFRAEDVHHIAPRRSLSSSWGSRSRSVVPNKTNWNEVVVKVDRICGRLPGDLRLIAAARYVERLSVRDIAEQTHTPKNRIERECAEVVAWVAGAIERDCADVDGLDLGAALDSPDRKR